MVERAPTETELKIPVPELVGLRRRLQALGARLERAREHERNLLFDTPERRLTALGQALRLRLAGGRWVLTHKGPVSYQGQIKVREELELEVGDGQTLAVILGRLGLEPFVRYEKERESWRLGGVEVALDHTALGEFVELEGRPDELGVAATALGLEPARAVRGSYLTLWEEHRHGHPELGLPVDMLLPPR
jgi:predicted adenylyl cyclase CyaB